MQNKALFDNYRYCDFCRRDLSPDYEGTTCPSCLEHLLFQEVKDFIRSNDVNEYQVATHFNVPIKLIRGWIREGRIQYKETTRSKVMMHCQICGAQVAFGSICPKCLKEQNVSGTLSKPNATDAGNMRHLKINKKESTPKNVK